MVSMVEGSVELLKKYLFEHGCGERRALWLTEIAGGFARTLPVLPWQPGKGKMRRWLNSIPGLELGDDVGKPTVQFADFSGAEARPQSKSEQTPIGGTHMEMQGQNLARSSQHPSGLETADFPKQLEVSEFASTETVCLDRRGCTHGPVKGAKADAGAEYSLDEPSFSIDKQGSLRAALSSAPWREGRSRSPRRRKACGRTASRVEDHVSEHSRTQYHSAAWSQCRLSRQQRTILAGICRAAYQCPCSARHRDLAGSDERFFVRFVRAEGTCQTWYYVDCIAMMNNNIYIWLCVNIQGLKRAKGGQKQLYKDFKRP